MDFGLLDSAYPMISETLGESWLKNQENKPLTKKRRIFVYLEKALKYRDTLNQIQKEIDRISPANIPVTTAVRYYSISIYSDTLSILDKCLTELKTEQNFRSLVKELKGDPLEFVSSVTLAILACYFKARCNIGLFPALKFPSKIKKPDLSLTIDSRRIYVEATTPGTSMALVESPQGVVLRNRAVGQILDEYDENFREAVQQKLVTVEPIIIALDLRRTEIEPYEIEEAIKSKFVAANDAITGVVWFNGALHENGRVELIGEYLANPSARNSLTPLERSNLGFSS
jgi:hypothetical protein